MSEACATSNSPTIRQYIAVRSAGNLKDCLFFSWEAAAPHLVTTTDGLNLKYKVFGSLAEAEQFICSNEDGDVSSTAAVARAGATSRRVRSGKKRKSPPAATAAAVAAATVPNPATNEKEDYVVDPIANNDAVKEPSDSLNGAGSETEHQRIPAAAAATAAAVTTEEDKTAVVAKMLAGASHYKPSEQWEELFSRLAALSVNGKLPERIEDDDLRNFFYRQHKEYRKLLKGEHSAMSEYKLEKLKKIGFVFGTGSTKLPTKVKQKKFDTEFETMITKLSVFAVQNGHCNVVKAHKEHRDLFRWITKVRSEYKKLSVPEERDRCRLSLLQMQRLTDMGFCFRSTTYKSWEERLEELKAYQAAGNDINKIPTLNHELGEFVGRNRKDYKHFMEGRSTAMTKERIQKLEEMGFDWNTHLHRETAKYAKPKTWEQRFRQLQEYYDQHGDTLVHKNAPDGLGQWVAAQRKAFKMYASGKKSSLNPEKVGKLVEIGFIVDANVYKKRRKLEEPEPDLAPAQQFLHQYF